MAAWPPPPSIRTSAGGRPPNGGVTSGSGGGGGGGGGGGVTGGVPEAEAYVYPAPQYFPPNSGGAASSPRLYDSSPRAGTRPHARFGSGGGTGGGISAAAARPRMSSGANAAAPSAPPLPGGRREVVPFGARRPLRRDASWFAILAFLYYLGALVFYVYVRVLGIVAEPRDRWYSITIFVIELIGVSAVIPYGLVNTVHTHPASSPGLPVDDGTTEPPDDEKFVVRVLVPCYKEGLDVVGPTVDAALTADLPPGVTRYVYLCDDGDDATKRAWLEERYGGRGDVVYVAGRVRAKGEINGKSANLNNCLKNVIYGSGGGGNGTSGGGGTRTAEPSPGAIPPNEIVVVFDADMRAKRNFFCKILEPMLDPSVALTLSPQAFSNVHKACDIFNNSNQQFWEYVLPGCDALGYIACTGTNFCLRAKALAAVGWFPAYCITEDYALSMELKAAGYQGAYLAEYLAVGEAPAELRNVLRQRSRWTKGHMQVFFSARNPLFRWKLPLLHKWLYSNGTWSYFATVATTWTFLLIPFVSLMFDLQPVQFSKTFALAATLYLSATFVVQNYFHVGDHVRGIWLAQVSNYLLCFTYAKAITNTLLAKLHIKQKAGFKPTTKTSTGAGAPPALDGAAEFPVQTAVLARLTSLTRRFNQATLPHLYDEAARQQRAQAAAKAAAVTQKSEDDCIPEKLTMFVCLNICINTLVLALRQVFVARRVTAWVLLPTFWSLYNSVPPLLFFSFVLGSSKFLQIMTFWMQLVSIASGFGAMVCLWFIVVPSSVAQGA